MEHQRQRAGGGRRRRRKQRQNQPRTVAEPILIAARRPNAPFVARAPQSALGPTVAPAPEPKPDNGVPSPAKPPAPRRSARIVQVVKNDADERERERRRLLDRIMASETRGAITRTTDDYLRGGFELPAEQPFQLQLLEHFDEEKARCAVDVLTLLLAKDAPYKRPILEQRLRRLEEYGEDPSTRAAAAELRRAIRG
jgi:hypothetical protein